MKLIKRYSKTCLCEELLVFLNAGVCSNVLCAVPKGDALIQPNGCDSCEEFKSFVFLSFWRERRVFKELRFSVHL